MSAAPLLGELESPRPLRAIDGHLAATGWCLIPGQSSPPRVRLQIGKGSLLATGGQPRSDVAQLFPHEPAAAICGFSLVGELPAGVHLATLQAQTASGEWLTFKRLSLSVDTPPLAVVIDTPLSHGTLRDRVKVGGWALDRTQPLKQLSLRYGHREIACIIDQPREDVPQLFPTVPHASRAGFTTEDFLVAGHGPVRARALLSDGSIAVAPTSLHFSIATDENHSTALDLTAPRIGLPGYEPPRLPPPATSAAAKLNILFVLPGSFSSNNALHVAGLANELSAAGHACAVAVARDPDTISHHASPAFSALLHHDGPNHRFPDGRGPDVIHAWTTRECVRLTTASVTARHRARVVVHLEDNEQQILALSLGRDFAELATLSDRELDRLIAPDLSHPRRSSEFLAAADGISLIMPALQRFAPASSRCHTIWPAADARYFFPRPRPDEFRKALCLPPDSSVLFYHGNVHAANAAEVRELYLAVAQLNAEGVPVTLLRTGLDTVDFLGDDDASARRHVLELGQILHHRHLAPLMAMADFFAQPGYPDPFNDYRFPSKLPEFFAIGRPVILPRTNLGSVVRHGIDAYVLERADAAGLARAIRELRSDPALVTRLSRGALAFAQEHFNWQRSAEALANFYHQLTPSHA